MDLHPFEDEVLLPFFIEASTVESGVFDWSLNHLSKKTKVVSSEVIIVEGIGLFRPELINYSSHTIWIDCPLIEPKVH